MAFKSTLAVAGLAALALAATTAGAFAATAYAIGNVNVRNGAGTYYDVVDTLLRGQQVDVQYCQDSWCYVQKPGPDGWVSANYLNRGRPAYTRPDWDNDYGWNDAPHPNFPHPPMPKPYPVYPGYGYGYQNGYPNFQRPHYPHYNNGGGSSVCVNGPNGYFCLGD